MNKTISKPWVRYVLVFIVALVLVGGWFRFGPYVDPEGSNLLVNSVLALILTAVYVVLEKFFLKVRGREVEK